MDDSLINLENILEQAPKWTFAGDYTLLQWMTQISEELESMATKTTDALTKLNNNIKSTNIALDNVANRLTTLQFGNQFVECRVQDDDETVINTNEQSSNKENQPEVAVTSEELLSTFLNNNLKVLRNCHERYSIDLDDSDDEEISKEKTCIYQAINPYNERPLPHIFGSKDWHSKWHVGLYENEQDNSYSGDEMSEAFSETSSTSHLDDNESFESNTEWASSNSIDNDNFNANIEIKNASSLQGSQALHPGTPLPINTAKSKPAAISESSSLSTTPSSLATNVMQTKKQQENLSKRSESLNSVNSRTSSKQIGTLSANKMEDTLQYKTPKQKVVDLFADPSEDNKNASFSSASTGQNVKRVANDTQLSKKEGTPALRSQPAPFIDLFAEPPEDFSSSTTSSLSSSHNIKRKVVNLFDDDDDITAFAKEEKFIEPDNKANEFLPPVTMSKAFSLTKTSNSLFDDSDDDDDFLKAFVTKSLSKEATKSSVSKTLLFDNTTNDSTENSSPQARNDNKNMTSEGHSSYKTPIIFDATRRKEIDLFSNAASQIPVQNPVADDVIKSSNSSKALSSHLDKPTGAENANNSENVFKDFVAETKTSRKINLFDDLEDEDDLFSIKPKNIKETTPPPTVVEKVVELQKETTLKVSEDNTVTKGAFDIGNQLAKSDSLLDNNSVLDKIENIEKDQTINKNVNPETTDKLKDIKLLQVDIETHDNEELVEPPMQEQHNIVIASQPTDNIAVAIPEDTIQHTKSTNKYEISSILFSDEPPEDDDEFFETLAKTTTNPNSNYNAIDLENDIFEPDLPKVPVASTNSNQSDSADSFYTGLQLFSDIPPDDDAMSSSTLNSPADAKHTKRLHSVFYDDFSETLMALNQKQSEEAIPEHSIFNHEPPPMNDNLNCSSKDLTDHKVPDKKHDMISTDYNATSQENNYNTEEVSTKRQVSKLQMPHININVQALLPGASSALRKPTEDDTKSDVKASPKDDANQTFSSPVPAQIISQLSAGKTPLPEASRTSETEHILPNMTKNRVKAPAARRPSTRRARQENYRKSLIEQQNTLASDEDHSEKIDTIKTGTKSIISQISQQNKTSKDSGDAVSSSNHSSYGAKTAALNENRNQSGSHLIGMAKSDENSIQSSATTIQKIEDPTNSVLLSSKSEEVSTKKQVNTLSDTLTLISKQLNSSLFFDAAEEDDDDFFKDIRKSNISGSRKAKENEEHLLAKSSCDMQHLETNSNTEIPQEINKETNAQNVTTTAPAYQEQPASEIKISDQFVPNNLKSFLNDDNADEDLFTTAITPSKSSLSHKELNSKAKSQFKSFLDSETEEEPNIAGQQTTLSTASSNANVKTKNTKHDKAKLFSDSETDSDDMFGKFASTKNSMNKKSPAEVTTKSKTKPEPKSTLFEDESDSDDFLSSKSSLSKNVPKIATQANTTLFSDLDSEEDDLFGSGAAKVIPANVTNIRNFKPTSAFLPTATAAESSKTQTVNDNPLADLL